MYRILRSGAIRLAWRATLHRTVLLSVCLAWLGFTSGPGYAADLPTPTTAPVATAMPTASPAPTATATTAPTSTPTQTPRPTPVPTPLVEVTRPPRRRHHHHATPTPHPSSVAPATVSVVATPTPAKPKHRHKPKHKHHHRAAPTSTPTATATVTPTPTPLLSLSTEDSIKPVTCNGPARVPASDPFLSPPYAGWTSIVSYFDHDEPNFAHDGLVITTTGLQAQPDSQHHAADFPAYWNASIRQYLYYDGHNGYDYNLWYQPVYAAAPGKVIFAGMEYPTLPHSGYGNMVMIAHRGGYVTLYGHFSRLLVKEGQHVKRLQQIGVSGNTGHSTGPHLHFTVFHNCTPTDPYGWTGAGPDPLSTYEGESSIYLWLSPPLVTNPIPHMPGLGSLPGSSDMRLLLLRLPSTRKGTGAFIHNLRLEADGVRRALGSHFHGATLDLLRGAIDFTAPISPARLYALPDVASIASPDVESDARADLLSALAQAALVTRHRALPLTRSHSWTGYLFHWEGRTFLVGHGPRAKHVDLRLGEGGSGTTVHRLQTDPANGAYAIDLGRMSRHESALLAKELATSSSHTVVSVRPSVKETHRAQRVQPSHSSSTRLDATVIALLLLVVGGGAIGWMWTRGPWRRRAL